MGGVPSSAPPPTRPSTHQVLPVNPSSPPGHCQGERSRDRGQEGTDEDSAQVLDFGHPEHGKWRWRRRGTGDQGPKSSKSNTEARPGGPVSVGRWMPWLLWGRSLLLSGVTWLVLARVQVSLWHLLGAACVCGVQGQLGCWTGSLISIDASQVWGLEKGGSDS